MRKFALILTIGLFFSATAANACDGGKASKVKGKKAHCTCTHKTAMASSSATKSACSSAKCSKGCAIKSSTATQIHCGSTATGKS